MLIKPAKDSVDLLIFVNGIRKSLESGLLPGDPGSGEDGRGADPFW
jgi:hypothetical protein